MGLKKEGRLNAILGYFSRNDVMTTPLFGYDTSIDQKTGLYRMLTAILVEEAKQKSLLLNMSSGAAEFKRCRGAESAIEYTAVYVNHLPYFRRVGWKAFEILINKIGIPLLQKSKL